MINISMVHDTVISNHSNAQGGNQRMTVFTEEEKKAKKHAYYLANKDRIKAYRESNKEKIAEQKRKYREDNKEKIVKYNKEYRNNNKEKQKIYMKEWEEQNKKERDLYRRGYREINKEKISKRKKIYNNSNKEKLSIQAKQYADFNKEKISARKKAYNKANKEKISIQRKIYGENNKDKKAAQQAKRRAAKMHRTPKWLTEKDYRIIEDFYKQARHLKEITGIEYHVDHIIPLQGKNVSGLHVPENLQIITAIENMEKNNNF